MFPAIRRLLAATFLSLLLITGAIQDAGAIHYRTLSMLGLPLGEQFILDPLAADCAADKRYEFMMVSVPMNLEGGIASPPNAVAIK